MRVQHSTAASSTQGHAHVMESALELAFRFKSPSLEPLPLVSPDLPSFLVGATY